MVSSNNNRIDIWCDAVLFDLDGVLVDSSRCVEYYWRRWAAEHQLDPDVVMRTAYGRRAVETIRLVAPHLNPEIEGPALEDAENRDMGRLLKIDGSEQLTRSLPAGAWAIATSGTRKTALARLAFGNITVPPVLVTADDVRFGKPDPEPYLKAAAALGAAPANCVVIEDAPAGIQAAQSAGMRVIAVTTTHAPADLKKADLVAGRLSDIESLPLTGGAAGQVHLQVKVIQS